MCSKRLFRQVLVKSEPRVKSGLSVGKTRKKGEKGPFLSGCRMAKSGNYAKCNVPQKLYGVAGNGMGLGKQGMFQSSVFVA